MATNTAGDKAGLVSKQAKNTIKDGEIALINKFTKRELKEDEVYVFSVVLCDNDIDRQYERFTDKALGKLSELFIGKTGIMDHDVVSNNQTARIFSCEVQELTDKTNCEGNPYKRLVARAYMPKSPQNKDFILLIDSGIKKEVSINCCAEDVRCSICGSNIKTDHCSHLKGKKYKKAETLKTCHYILDNPIDAYEWSFVVIPAQREAGVIKSFSASHKGGTNSMDEIIKCLEKGQNVNLNGEQSQKLYGIVSSLQKKAKIAEAYREGLNKEVIKLICLSQPDIKADIIKSVVNKMDIDELQSFKAAYLKKNLSESCIKPQIFSHTEAVKAENLEYKI